MEHKQKLMLKPEAILRYLIFDDEKMDTLIMCKSSEVGLHATDQAVYEALASVKGYDPFRLNKLAKLFEVVEVTSARSLGQERAVLTHQRVEELREMALGDAL